MIFINIDLIKVFEEPTTTDQVLREQNRHCPHIDTCTCHQPHVGRLIHNRAVAAASQTRYMRTLWRKTGNARGVSTKVGKQTTN